MAMITLNHEQYEINLYQSILNKSLSINFIKHINQSEYQSEIKIIAMINLNDV